jgi:thousand and one amino acid protein kinase
MEVESHKQLLEKEYESLMQQFSKELEKLQARHHQELDRKLKQNQNAEKKLHKEITSRHEADRKALEAQQKREYKVIINFFLSRLTWMLVH